MASSLDAYPELKSRFVNLAQNTTQLANDLMDANTEFTKLVEENPKAQVPKPEDEEEEE